ncbi:uncharacterized protein NECHADRAFT_75383 [Fusarium vanettenii 77-13-4]|uniref:Uncharacterized protein n=1 Tax=Fusarium vanettenii (strain ATCC MYA-4622 / CBS 123669 / FGSC 9596 / NRRL 45880 / 77-13-4) TaxID=660122 RepID=C7YIN2_FUSV7|nr:uncharacterized protein NECHADRAFT_75383 [Fusarium vanettenii 77-13-4]EEU48123.1 hypothetical protein NECHADRAFT_75383 [Fusarium vanettenii 77-13-4]
MRRRPSCASNDFPPPFSGAPAPSQGSMGLDLLPKSLLSKTSRPRTESAGPQRMQVELEKHPAFRGYVERFERWTTATLEWVDWSEPDEWRKRLTRTAKISPDIENKALLEVLREGDIEIDDIPCFIQPSRSSARWDRRVSQIEKFCAGGEFVLQNTIAGDPERSEVTGTQEPEAWVSDRNWVDEALVGPRPNYPRILDNKKLFRVLEKTVEGFRNLFADYVTPTPEPKFRLRESTWWGGCFVISFNIPYYGISTRDLQDCRTISNGGKRLRNRHDLDFLHLHDHEPSEDERASFHDHAILHEAVYSLTVTGKSDKYWTAACLDDHAFNEESNLESDEETEVLVGKSDPIIFQAEVKKAEVELTKSPRAYAVAALKIALDKIVEHHGNVQDWFKTSFYLHTSDGEDGSPGNISAKEMDTWLEKFPKTLNYVVHSTSSLVTQLDHFLEKDVILGPDALPQGVLWQSLQHDAIALRSLLGVKQCRDDLCGIEGELKQLEIAYEGVRRKRKYDNEGEQQILTKQVHRIAIAAFVFAIPNTVAQLYSAMPDMGGSASWPSYVAMVMVCILMGAAVAMYLSGEYWQKVRRWFERVVTFLSETFRALRRHE